MKLKFAFEQLISLQTFQPGQQPVLNPPISSQAIADIENLIGEKLPVEFLQLYSFADGQSSGEGVMVGEKFISSAEIIDQLQFSRTLIKPTNPTVKNPRESERLVQAIVEFFVSKAPKHSLLGLKKSWYKLEFQCSPNSFGGPYLFLTEQDEEGDVLEIGDFDEGSKRIQQLHDLERESYNWDELEFTIYANGKYSVNRNFYNFDSQIPFTSTPEGAIRKKYFHMKWVPLFSDHAGNYIGIDLDPDVNGTKGQIINFGRDEERMFVIAKNLESFFIMINAELSNPQSIPLNNTHLHDNLRKLVKR